MKREVPIFVRRLNQKSGSMKTQRNEKLLNAYMSKFRENAVAVRRMRRRARKENCYKDPQL